MKVFVSVDIEGVAGVSDAVQGRAGHPEHDRARRLMTGEASAAVRGAFAGGAETVMVADSHGTMLNLLPDELDPRARLIAGAPRPGSMLEGLDGSFGAVVLVGFHARAGAVGVMSHTYSGAAFAEIRINGTPVGEFGLFRGLALELGVPVVAVTGDDRLAEEVAAVDPTIARVVVKRCLGNWASDGLSPERSRALIEASVAEAVRVGRKAPAGPHGPLSVDIEMTKQGFADAAALVPTVERTGARAVRFEAADHGAVVRLIQALAYLAMGVVR